MLRGWLLAYLEMGMLLGLFAALIYLILFI